MRNQTDQISSWQEILFPLGLLFHEKIHTSLNPSHLNSKDNMQLAITYLMHVWKTLMEKLIQHNSSYMIGIHACMFSYYPSM